MGIYDNCGRLKNICRRKNLYEYLGAYSKRIHHVQIASIDADLSHANFYPDASRRFTDLGIRNEWKPRIPSALFISPANISLCSSQTVSSVICVDQGWPCQLLFAFQSFIYFSNQAVARKRLLQKEHAFQEIAAAIVEF
jgi:hypothetical protein